MQGSITQACFRHVSRDGEAPSTWGNTIILLTACWRMGRHRVFPLLGRPASEFVLSDYGWRFLTFQNSVGSIIRTLADTRSITTVVYHTFKGMTEAISSRKEFGSLADDQLYEFCEACYYDRSYSLGRPLFRHWLNNMGGLLELVFSISTRQELTTFSVSRCVRILETESNPSRCYWLLVIMFSALKSMDVTREVMSMKLSCIEFAD